MEVMILKGDIFHLGFNRIVLPVDDSFTPLNQAAASLADHALNHNWTFIREAKWPKPGEVMPSSLIEEDLSIYFVNANDLGSDEAFYDFMVCCIWNCLAQAYNETVEYNLEEMTLAFSNLFEWNKKADPKLCARAFKRVIGKMQRLYPESKKVKTVLVLDSQKDYASFKEVFGL